MRPSETVRLGRRRFIDWVLSRTLTTWLLSTGFGGLLTAVLYPVGRYLVPPEAEESAVSSVTLPLRTTDVRDNTGTIFKFGRQPGILIRTPSGELRAFSALCTHLDCIVQYREDLGHIWCACHNGHFDLTGRNVSGPPPEPLTPFEVRVRGDQIIVNRGG
jgi:cytochrome b6-f complex iron-sulfur subunit